MVPLLLGVLLLWSFSPGEALAQDRFEIQVYDAETAGPGHVGIELHLNAVAAGTTQTSADGELPTSGVTHLTLEPHLGLTRFAELGAYFQAALRPDGSINYAGVKLRFKMRLPWRVASGLIGLALNLELSAVPAGYEANVYGSELRPIIDLRWRRLYAAINPIIDTDLSGALAGRPQLQPAFKISGDVTGALALGAEYYTNFGAVTGFLPAAQQTHQLYGVLDLVHRINDKIDFELNFGVGYNLTDSADRVVVKAIIGIGQAETPPARAAAPSGASPWPLIM